MSIKYDRLTYFVGTFVNEPVLILSDTVKWFQILLCNDTNVISVTYFYSFK